MTYELRRYTAAEGHFDDVLERFQNVSLVLFAEYGIRGVGYWTPQETPGTLVYVVEHTGDADANWAKFLADERWLAAREKYGAIVDKVQTEYIELTPFSPRP